MGTEKKISLSKTPTFAGLKPASEASSRSKRANRHLDTEHEQLLRSTLWRMGLRFRKNVKNLAGKPDIVFPRAKVAVFCDGDFWHGRNWVSRREKLMQGANPDYWVAKIQRNMERDLQVTNALEGQGWFVIRVWETDIKRDPNQIAHMIKTIIELRIL